MAKVLSFRAEFGTSIEVDGVWYKLYAAIEVAPEGDETLADVKDKAWNTVVDEVEKQVDEIRR
jgi:hypothetical protein